MDISVGSAARLKTVQGGFARNQTQLIWNSNHFAVLDDGAVRGNIRICKIGDKTLQRDALSFRRKTARDSSNFLGGLEPDEREGM
jgi:hypothetical protein